MPRHGSATAAEPEPAVQAPTSRRGLAGWPIRRKLVTLVAGPLVLILGAGLFFTAQSVTALRSAQQARDLANVAMLTNDLVSSLNNEMSRTMRFTNSRNLTAAERAMRDSRKATDIAYERVRAEFARAPEGSWSADVEAARSNLTDVVSTLAFVRRGVDRGNGNLVIQRGYTKRIDATLAVTNALARDLSLTAPDPQTVDAAFTLGSLSGAASAASLEVVRLGNALVEHRLSLNTSQGLQELKIQQEFQLAQATAHATPAQRKQIQAITDDGERIDRIRKPILDRAASGNSGDVAGGAATQPVTSAADADEFASAAASRVDALNKLVASVTTGMRDDATSNAKTALLKTGLVASLALLSLLLASALVTVVARTVTVPMRRLRAGAVDAATVRLPAMVRQIERDGPDSLVALPPVLPPGTVAGPETIEVAQAVDGLTSEAVRLATAQVRLRQALDEAFVSMSRRSQSMVEKQLAIIDELESTEEDPEQLRNLFRLDHLAARMRRYNDNLLVLAGSALRTRSAAPVPIADVFRAATSEMEQYERVRLQPVNGVAISGPVAGGLVHLLAELLDNAAMYSPPTSPILLAGSLLPDGSLHLEITDSGVGIPASELADLNARLAMPGSIDTQVPSRMGLYVVARLAQRGGFTVRLSPRAQAAGTVAEVDVAASMVVDRTGQRSGGAPVSQPVPTTVQNGAPHAGQMLQPLQALQPLQPLQPGQSSGQPGQPGHPVPLGQPGQPGQLVPLGQQGLLGQPGRPEQPGAGRPGEPGHGPGSPLPTRSPRELPAPFVPGHAGQPGQEGTGPAEAGQAGSPAVPAPGAPGAPKLPSRRPGAALVGKPLGAVPQPGGAQDSPGVFADPSSATPGTPAPASPGAPMNPFAAAARTGAPGAPGTPGTTGAAEPPAPRFEAPRGGELPRRTRGSALAGTPLAGPPSGPMPLAGGATSGLFGAPSSAAAPPAPDTNSAPAGGSAVGSSAPTSPAHPLRPFSEGRQPSSRPPFRPGATGAQAGASAATAAAAAARARTETTGRPPTPGTGLFATTGPATLPAGMARPGPSLRLGDGGTVRPVTGAPTRPEAPAARAGQSPGQPSGQAPAQLPAALPLAPSPAVSAPVVRPPAPGPAAAAAASSTELEARSAAAGRYPAADPDAPMIGVPDLEIGSPIFDSISAWFSTDPAPAPAPAAPGAAAPPRVIDLRDDAPAPALAQRPAATTSGGGPGANRWAALGDQQWLATNARAAAGPSVAGNTEAGLPRRRPGANLLPSASEAAPASRNAPLRVPGASATVAPSVAPAAAAAGSAAMRPDADAVRGRLGSYQRGLTSARRARHLPGTTATTTAPPPLGQSESRPQDAEQQPADQGGDH